MLGGLQAIILLDIPSLPGADFLLHLLWAESKSNSEISTGSLQILYRLLLIEISIDFYLILMIDS